MNTNRIFIPISLLFILNTLVATNLYCFHEIFNGIESNNVMTVANIIESDKDGLWKTAFNKDGQTPLFRAVYKGNLDLAGLLLQKGHDPNRKNVRTNDGSEATYEFAESTPLFFLAAKENFAKADLEFLDLFFTHHADPRITVKGETPRLRLMTNLKMPKDLHGKTEPISKYVQALLSHAITQPNDVPYISKIFPFYGSCVDFSCFIKNTCLPLNNNFLVQPILTMASDFDRWIVRPDEIPSRKQMALVIENLKHVMPEAALLRLMLQFKGLIKSNLSTVEQTIAAQQISPKTKPGSSSSNEGGDSPKEKGYFAKSSGNLTETDSINNYSAHDLANTIFEIDRELFLAVSVTDIFNTKTASHSFRQLLEFGSRIQTFISISLINNRANQEVSHIIKKWIEAGKLLKQQGDFFGVFHVVSGLKDHSIARLTKENSITGLEGLLPRGSTLDKSIVKNMQQLNEVIACESNFKNYRNSIHAIPMASVERRDFIGKDEGTANYTTFYQIESLNMEKIKGLCEFLQKHETTQYELKTKKSPKINHTLKSLLLELPNRHESTIEQLSYLISPNHNIQYAHESEIIEKVHPLYWTIDQLHYWFIQNNLIKERKEAILDDVIDGLSLYPDYLLWKEAPEINTWRSVVYKKLADRLIEAETGKLKLLQKILDKTKANNHQHFWVHWLSEKKGMVKLVRDLKNYGISDARSFYSILESKLPLYETDPDPIYSVLHYEFKIAAFGFRKRLKTLYSKLTIEREKGNFEP